MSTIKTWAFSSRPPLGQDLDGMVMARLRAPFGCELVGGHWRIFDANDDAIASCSSLEEGYARLIASALNEYFEKRGGKATP
jgi:hypothetical protein